MLEPEAVEIEWKSQRSTDHRQHQHIEENRERIVRRSCVVGEVTKSAAPTQSEQHYQQQQTQSEVGNAQPSLDAVVAPRFSRIGCRCCMFGFRDHP